MPGSAGQVKDYDKFYDYNIAVVGSRHGEHVHEHVPEHWGIITAEESDGSVDFYFLRQPQCTRPANGGWKVSLLCVRSWHSFQEWNDMPKYKD